MPNQKIPPDEWSESDRAALEHVREELRERDHRAWLWQSIGRISKWSLAVIAGITVVTDAVLRLLKAWAER